MTQGTQSTGIARMPAVGRGAATPLAAVGGAVMLWGLGPLFVRGASVSGMTVSFYRMWLAIPVMTVLMTLAHGRYTWRGIREALIGGVLFAACVAIGFTSYRETSIANATLIPALLPLLVFVVAGRLFGEPPQLRDIFIGIIAVGGVGAVVFGGHRSGTAHVAGDLAAVANLVVWTLYFLEVKRRRRAGIPALSYLACVFVVGSIALTPFALLTAPDLTAVRPVDFVLVMGLVLFPGAAGHGLMTWAQRSVNVTVSSVLTLLSPVVSAAGAWILFSEPLSGMQIAGAAVVLGAMAALSVAHRTTAVPVGDLPDIPPEPLSS